MQFYTQQRSKCQILLSMSVISPKLHFLGFSLLIYLFLFLLLLSSAIFLRVVLIWLFLMNEGNGKFYLLQSKKGNGKLDWKWKHHLLCLTHWSWINSNLKVTGNWTESESTTYCVLLIDRGLIRTFKLLLHHFWGYTSCVD